MKAKNLKFPKKQNNDYSYNCNMFYEDKENNITQIEVNEVECCFIDRQVNFTMQILAEKKEIYLTFSAKELLSCLNKLIILQLKENLKIEIDNL